MAPRTTVFRSAALLAGLLLAGSLAAVDASAQSGNGLYEPFPEAAVKKRAHRYVERLGERTPGHDLRLSDDKLAAGAFVKPAAGAPPLRPADGSTPGAASGRAGGGGADVALGIQLLLLAAALAFPAAAVAGRARVRAG